jgi:putative long chain acyl-CoA synthase
MGSGMPRGLLRRVAERFAPARVVEFYASTQGEAVLVNVRGQKIGAMGRPLPGSARVKIAAYDLVEGRLEQDSRGFVREVSRGETGLLLSEVDPEAGGFQAENALRGVFRRDDAWLPTGDLFRQDEDGDYWLMDSASALIRTADGIVSPGRVRAALESLEAVDLAVCYGVSTDKPGRDVAVAAVMLCRGAELRPADLGEALGRFVPDARPAVVQVVDEIPVTTWYRPITGPLRKAGLPEPGEGVQAWARDAKGNYRSLTPTARKRLAAGR